MKITEHEMRGLLAGKCLPGDMRVNEDLPTYLVRKFAELQQKLDAMAAENAVLKSNLMFWDAEDPEAPYDCPEDIANNCCIDVGVEFDVKVAAKMPDRTYRVSSADDYSCGLELVYGGIPETPATDDYLNSVRAEGVDISVAELKALAKRSIEQAPNASESIHASALYLITIAEQLRSGTHDTANKAG